MNQVESCQRSKVTIQMMLKFLHLQESELLHIPKEMAIQCLNKIVDFFSSLSKRNIKFSTNHGHQPSNGHNGINDFLATSSDSSTLVNKSMNPLDLLKMGSSYFKTSPLAIPAYDHLQAREDVNPEFMLHFNPDGTTCKNTVSLLLIHFA